MALLLVLAAAPCRAHDLSVDVSGTLTTTSADNPRAGSFGVGAAGAYDVNDAWSVSALAVYTRDLATRTPQSFSPGSNVFLFNVGATWLPTDSLMTMLTVAGSPPVEQRNATLVEGPLGRTVDLVVRSRTWTLGALWNGLWSSNGDSRWEHTVDVSLGFNHFSVLQQLEVPDTPAGALLVQACADGRPLALCPLVRGTTSPLWQGRFGAGYTATLAQHTDLGLEGTYFLYDRPPSSVGYFSLVSIGRELGSGVPVLPVQLSLKPSLAQRFGPVTLKLTYQYALYTESLGALHAGTLKVSWKVTPRWRVSLTATAQLDVAGGAVSNPGGQALLGVLYAW